MKHLRLIPDRGLVNTKTVDLARALTSLYEPPLRRWNGRGFTPPACAAWEVVLSPRQTRFVLTLPDQWAPVLKRQTATVWPRTTIKRAVDPLERFTPTAAGALELKEHAMFSLRVDRRSLAPVSGILEALPLMKRKDCAVVQVLLTPAAPDWWQGMSAAYEDFRDGKMPKRVQLDGPGVARYAARGVAGVVFEAISLATEAITGEEPEPVDLDGIDKARTLRDGPMGKQTPAKLRGDAFETTIRLAVESEDQRRAHAILRALGFAFRELDGDNALVMKPAKPQKVAEGMWARRQPFKANHDYLSTEEVSRLLQLPTASLQEEHKIASVDLREVQVPAAVTKGGLRLGAATYRGKKQPVYLPTDNRDELCLPHLVIGGMGSGKTRGFGANMAVEAVRNGFNAVVIDPAKGEIGDEVESVLPPAQVTRIRFGHDVVALDWREVKHGQRTRNLLANVMVAFFEAAADETGPQTARYLRSAAKAAGTGRLPDVARLFTDAEYLDSLLPTMRPQERGVWEAFADLSPARQAQIAAPVLNRLDTIMGDDYLAECLEADDGLDLAALIDEKPRAIILDVPKSALTSEGVDVVGSMMATKLDLAMVLRSSERPVMVVQDEPHAYMRSARIWRRVAVESRKYRFGYTWLFHAAEQIPRDLFAIMQSAGPHLHLYASSKATYRMFEEEIKPYSVEDALRTPKYHAINVVQAGQRTARPFLSRMLEPPSKR